VLKTRKFSCIRWLTGCTFHLENTTMFYNISTRRDALMEYSFPPLINAKSRILVLGSLPGVRSLELNQYYAHPQNSFWKIMFVIFGVPFSKDYGTRCSMLLENGLALWDVIKCADRAGSSDSLIKNKTPNDVPGLLTKYRNISLIIYNGSCALTNYKKYFGEPPLPYMRLLSTSPACAGKDVEKFKMWEETM